jgi:ABC-2 type transport system permease protein
MSWAVVATKDFRDGIRSRALWALSVLFILFAGGFTYVFWIIPQLLGQRNVPPSGPTVGLISGLSSSAGFLVPLIGLLIGYKAIVGERDSGSLKLLLGLPHSRRDVVLGKLIGRTGVVAVAILIGFAAGGIIALLLYDSFALGAFVSYILLTVVLGLVFVAIAVGFSAAMRSASRALYGVLGLFVLFVFVWDFIPTVIRFVLNGFTLPNLVSQSDWATFVSLLNPTTAYGYASAALIPELPRSISESAPFYLQEWFGFVILGAWIVIPLILGYSRFATTDL